MSILPAATRGTTQEELPWYGLLWVGWPLVLVFVGGVMGGLCGGAAFTINRTIFKRTRNRVLRYVLAGLVSIGAVIVYFVLAGLFFRATRK